MRGLAVALLLVLPLAGCASPASARVDVLASFYPLAYLASAIGGGNVTVGTLVPPGVEPHDYEPTTSDLVRVSDAKLLVVEGAGFEAWIANARAQAKSTAIVTATDGVNLTGGDPHAWLDPVLFAREARNVEAGMAAAFPQHAAAFHARADALVANLTRLNADYRAGLADCSTPFVITNHDAFGYLARAYNFTHVGITGLSPDAEPDPQTVREVVDQAKAHNVTIVFFEELVSPRVAEVIAREAGAQTRVLSPLESAREGADYESVMRENLASLREAMRCR